MEGMKTAVGVVAAGLAALLLGVGAMPASAAASSFSPAVATTGTVQFTSTAPTDAVVGGPAYTPTASTNSDQPVSFAVDALTTNNACTPASGSFSFAHAGTCVIDAQVPADQNYGAAQAPQTFTVSPASTSTSLAVGASALTANVTAAPPGGGTPTGTVVFSVEGRVLGSGSLVNGVATLSYTVPPNITETILASYQGVPDYTTSSATLTASGPNIEATFVAKPTIAARVTSTEPKNKHGWWHTTIDVRFICDAAGSTIVGGCPRSVLLTRSSPDLTVTKTIRTASGYTATVTLRGIKLDTTSPKVEIVGVRNHAFYRGSRPPVTCAASDPISGIRSCNVVATVKRGSAMETITYTATATSWAGVTQRASETIYSKL